MDKPKKGKWYYARFGWGVVFGECMHVFDDGVELRFFWGGPIRSKYYVSMERIMDEGDDPRIITKILKFILSVIGILNYKTGK